MEELSDLKTITVELKYQEYDQRNFNIYNLSIDKDIQPKLLYKVIRNDIHAGCLLSAFSEHTNVDIFEINENNEQEHVYRMIISNNFYKDSAIIYKVDSNLDLDIVGSIESNYIPFYYSIECKMEGASVKSYGSTLQTPLIVPFSKQRYDSIFDLSSDGSIYRSANHLPLTSLFNSSQTFDIDPISYQITFPTNASMQVKFLSILSSMFLDSTLFKDDVLYRPG
jgi:hypothetical protein